MSDERTVKGNCDIQGNLNISRSVTAGGDARIQGSLKVGHNLRVDGWLEARNIKGAFKGLYATEGALRTAYPRPQPGWFAMVGDTLPAEIWRADDREWVPTGAVGGEFTVWLDQLEHDMEDMRGDVLYVKDAEGRIDDMESSIEDMRGLTQGEVKLNDIGNVSERHTTCQLPSVWRVVDGERSVGVMLEYSDPHGHSVVQEMHTSMVSIDGGCLTASDLDGPARVYTRSWCREKKKWSLWEESPRQSDVAAKADKAMFVTLSDVEYDALADKDEGVYYFVYEE